MLLEADKKNISISEKQILKILKETAQGLS